MLKKHLNKINWIRFVAVFLLLSLFFICKGVGMNTILHGGMSHEMMLCCDAEESAAMFGDPMDKFVATLPSVITFFAVLFIVFAVLDKFFSIEYKLKTYWYDFWLRRRVGSTHMYNFLNRLLSLGILQPKLF